MKKQSLIGLLLFFVVSTQCSNFRPMDITVIIVNYNVKHFLEQCLRSVQRASRGLRVETVVVDNNSQDGSQQMLAEKFPDVILIDNQDNPGFSKANNQGIEIARGKYVLLLNPDTIVQEDTFRTCFDFMEAHPEGGALGVKMLDGEGKFLPESKRALPTPMVSFYKIFGLASIFPKSKTFGKYHLTYLSKEENHEIEILSGAFMFMRKEMLDQIGGLDETFFMYGEDIDLSYRVLLAGYKNYYLADTKIIHYKGESTKKGSLNYVRVFYQAMIIFAKKHFGGNKQRFFIFFIRLAVYLRALLAIVSRMAKRFGFPILEMLMSYGIIYGIKEYWEHYVKYVEGGAYPPTFDTIAAPIYALVFISFLGIAGAYKRPFRIPPLINGTFWGFVAIATVSYLFPNINFSRAIVGLSSVFTLIMALGTRGLINLRSTGSFFFTEPQHKRAILIGEGESLLQTQKFIHKELAYPVEIVGISCEQVVKKSESLFPRLGKTSQLREIVRFYRVEELLFDAGSLSTSHILRMMEDLQAEGLQYKIIPPKADFLIGPQSVHTTDLSRRVIYKLNSPRYHRQKRLFDLGACLLLLPTFPLLFWRYKKPARALTNLMKVLSGQKHWVGYISDEVHDLPKMKTGVLSILHRAGGLAVEGLNVEELDSFYAREWSWGLDMEIVLRGWRWI